MILKYKNQLQILILSIFIFVTPLLVSADLGGGPPNSNLGGGGTTYNGGSQTVQNPLGGINSFCGLIKALLTAVIQIGIPIAVLFIVYAGFKFVLARGNPAKLQEARQGLLYTLLGIGIFLGAWLIAMVIANTVNSLGAGSGQNTIISCK